MKTAGYFLKTKREKLNLNLESISKKLKIDVKYLKALENDDYSVFDSKVIARGFLIKYAKLLGLDINKLEAFWRRDFKIEEKTNPFKKKNKRYLSHNAVLISFFSGILLIAMLVGYVRYFSFKRPPKIEVISPQNKEQVTKSVILLEGQTSPEAELYLNNSPIPVNKEGYFKENIYLSPGVNNLTLTAINQLGIKNKTILTIYNKDLSGEKEQKDSIDYNANELSIKHISTQPTFVEVKDDNKTLFSGFFITQTQKSFYGKNLSIFTDKAENLELFYNGNKINFEKSGEFFKKLKDEKAEEEKNLDENQESKNGN